MSLQHSWAPKFAFRFGANVIVGALLTSIIGALCVGAAGALFGWMLDLRSTPPSWDSGFLFPAVWLGAYLGSYSGIVGASAAVAASGAKPDSSIMPPRALLRNIALGQLFGTACAVSSYLLFAFCVAQFNGEPFVATVEDHLDLIIWGAPTLAICGSIAGALWKRDDNL